MQSASPIILALDVPDRHTALTWVKRLKPDLGIFKVGMQLFYKEGPAMVQAIREEGAQVFLDLKLHDIPNTVAHACESLLPLEPTFLTVHVSGGLAMLQAAQKIMAESPTRLLGITALTSLDQAAIQSVYPECTQSPSQWALHLAGLAQEAGLFGVVCSASENPLIRHRWGEGLCLVNPGIRPQGTDVQDQKRVLTPGEAMKSGAGYLVIGRPILQAADPIGTVRRIQEEIQHAMGVSA